MNKAKYKKSLGQNFLRDPKILAKIADFADIKKDDIVVEVGPGEGTLTKLLLEKAGKVIAIEKDSELAEKLAEKFKDQISKSKLKIINEDILEFRDSSFETRYVLIGNIPYYITGALFKKFLSAQGGLSQPKSITFVVQKEVAERIMAKDGKESILSISIKAYGEPFLGSVIKAGSFFPKPKVDSSIISIRNISKKRFEPPAQQKNISSLSTDKSLLAFSSARPVGLRKARSESFFAGQELEQKFFEILKKGFAHKRKLLIKNLAEMPRLNLDILKEIFKKCGISEKARAENLKVEDWFNLLNNL